MLFVDKVGGQKIPAGSGYIVSLTKLSELENSIGIGALAGLSLLVTGFGAGLLFLFFVMRFSDDPDSILAGLDVREESVAADPALAG